MIEVVDILLQNPPLLEPERLDGDMGIFVGVVIAMLVFAAIQLRTPLSVMASMIPFVALLPAVIDEGSLLFFFLSVPIVVLIFALEAAR